MALRLITKRLIAQQVPQIAARAFSAAPATSDAAPSVFDKLISLTIVDPGGARRKIPGMVGTIFHLFVYSLNLNLRVGGCSC